MSTSSSDVQVPVSDIQWILDCDSYDQQMANNTTKLVSKLLIITDGACIYLCIINYIATWKAQEKSKSGETDVQVQ
jgi:hypothetical protein